MIVTSDVLYAVGWKIIKKQFAVDNFLNVLFKIGVDFALKVLNWDSSTTIRLQLWDIAGKIICNYQYCNNVFLQVKRDLGIWLG